MFPPSLFLLSGDRIKLKSPMMPIDLLRHVNVSEPIEEIHFSFWRTRSINVGLDPMFSSETTNNSIDCA